MDTHGCEYDLGSRIAEVGIIWGNIFFQSYRYGHIVNLSGITLILAQ